MTEKEIFSQLRLYLSNGGKGIYGKAKKLLQNLSEENVIIGEAPEISCCVYEYTCTGCGDNRYDRDYKRFPLTLNCTSEELWIYEGDKNAAEKDLNELMCGRLEAAGGVFFSAYDALQHDSYFKMRNAFRSYNYIVMPETIEVLDGYTETVKYKRIGKYIPVFIEFEENGRSDRALVGYIYDDNGSERFMFEFKFDKKSSAKIDINWWIVAIGVFYFPVLIGYIIYLIYKKSKL